LCRVERTIAAALLRASRPDNAYLKAGIRRTDEKVFC